MSKNNFLDDTMLQPSKLRTRNWVEINDESRRAFNDNEKNSSNSNKFKTSMIKSNLCDYSDA